MSPHKSAGTAARSHNIFADSRAAKPREQVLAIGHAMQRRAREQERK